MKNDETIFAEVCALLAPFNKSGVKLTSTTNISADLELDSLAVMDFLASIEDHFDVIVPLNLLPDLETIEQIARTVQGKMEEK